MPEVPGPANEKLIGEITHYFTKIMVGIIKLSEPLKVGDTIRFKGHTTDFKQAVDHLEIEHVPLQEGKPGDSVGLKVSQHVREKDQVFKVQV